MVVLYEYCKYCKCRICSNKRVDYDVFVRNLLQRKIIFQKSPYCDKEWRQCGNRIRVLGSTRHWLCGLCIRPIINERWGTEQTSYGWETHTFTRRRLQTTCEIQDIIKINPQDIKWEAVDYNHANQDREQWTMNLWGLIRGEELTLTSTVKS